MFSSYRWKQLTNNNGIELLSSGAKAHSSLGIAEKRHVHLQRIYSKLHHEYLHMPILFEFKVSVKSMNCTTSERV